MGIAITASAGRTRAEAARGSGVGGVPHANVTDGAERGIGTGTVGAAETGTGRGAETVAVVERALAAVVAAAGGAWRMKCAEESKSRCAAAVLPGSAPISPRGDFVRPLFLTTIHRKGNNKQRFLKLDANIELEMQAVDTGGHKQKTYTGWAPI